MRLIYKIEFFTFWQTASGLTGGASANSLVRKNDLGLPIIPGRTLKGLLREAAEKINKVQPTLVTPAFVEYVFGKGEAEPGTGAGSKAAKCFFGNAELSGQLTHALRENPSQKQHLYSTIASTAIDEEGQALDRSLRQIEVTVPLTLYGYIDDFQDDQNFLDQMNYCFQWIKRMGTNRSRGMGRCQFKFEKLN